MAEYDKSHNSLELECNLSQRGHRESTPTEYKSQQIVFLYELKPRNLVAGEEPIPDSEPVSIQT